MDAFLTADGCRARDAGRARNRPRRRQRRLHRDPHRAACREATGFARRLGPSRSRWASHGLLFTISWRRCAARPRATWTSRPRAPTGYLQASGMEARHGYHFVQPAAQARALATGTLDLAPRRCWSTWSATVCGSSSAWSTRCRRCPTTIALPGAVWHTHEASCHYRDFRELPAASARACPARHPASGEVFVRLAPGARRGPHVWAWYPNPDGVFRGGQPVARALRRPHRARAPRTESGRDVLLAAHPSRGRRRLAHARGAHPVGVMAAAAVPVERGIGALWAAFGVLPDSRSDPESWPYGPQRFGEISATPRTAAQAARARADRDRRDHGSCAGAVLPGRRLARAGVLALAGGATLFFHSTRAACTSTRSTCSIVLMGSTAVGSGGAADRHAHAARAPVARWAWPAFLGRDGPVLLFIARPDTLPAAMRVTGLFHCAIKTNDLAAPRVLTKVLGRARSRAGLRVSRRVARVSRAGGDAIVHIYAGGPALGGRQSPRRHRRHRSLSLGARLPRVPRALSRAGLDWREFLARTTLWQSSSMTRAACKSSDVRLRRRGRPPPDMSAGRRYVAGDPSSRRRLTAARSFGDGVRPAQGGGSGPGAPPAARP